MSKATKRKRLFRTVLCLCIGLAFGLTGCGKMSSEEMAAIYEDEEKLANPYNSYNLSGKEQEIDGNRMCGGFDQIEGMVRVWEMDADRDMAVSLTYRMRVTAGKVKLVFIDPDDTVETIAEYTEQSGGTDWTSVGISLKEGLNRIKLVADADTAFEYEISVSDGTLLPL